MTDFLSNLRAERDERVQDLHLDLPIPTWDGGIVARFNILPRKRVEKFAKAKRTVEQDIDLIVEAVRELYAHDPDKQVEPGTRMAENDAYVRIEGDEGFIVKFDSVLMEKMGVKEVESARDVVRYMVKFNDIALGGLAGRLLMWMQNTDAEVADALVGE